MDPNATLQALLESIEDGEREDACWTFAWLNDWLSNGGFMPTVRRSDSGDWCINPKE